MLKNTIILLSGIAGTGKNTIAKAINKEDKCFKVVHHHSYLDPILRLFGDDSSVFWDLDDKGWGALAKARHVVLDTIANACPKSSSFVLTYELLAGDKWHKEIFTDIKKTAEIRGARFIPVRLICDLPELLQRVSGLDRAKFYKTKDKELIKKRFAETEVFKSGLPQEITIDVSKLSPTESAREILNYVGNS